MDITLARTFLVVAETGSFIDAARRMHVTQSTVSARIKGLENLLGRPLFERSKSGASLTSTGEQFQKHALALIRVWQHAQLEARLADQHRRHVAVGAPAVLWPRFLVEWIARLRTEQPDTAISARAGIAPDLTQRLLEGTLDLALLYRPAELPGILSEHLFDEEVVLVSHARSAGRRPGRDYVMIDWQPELELDHASALHGRTHAGLNLDLGPLAVDFLLANEASGYVPYRLVRHHIARGRLKLNSRARKFVHPVFVVFPEERDVEAFEPVLDSLRKATRSRA